MIVGNFYTFEYEILNHRGYDPYKLGKYLGIENYGSQILYKFQLYDMRTARPIMSRRGELIAFPAQYMRNINLLDKLNSPIRRRGMAFDDDITPFLGPDAVYPKYHAEDVAGQTGGRKRRQSKKSKPKSKRRTRTNKRLK